MLGAEIDGYKVIGVAYKKGDPSQDVIALLGNIGPHHYEFGVVKMAPDGTAFAGEVGDTTDDEQTAWEAFGERTA